MIELHEVGLVEGLPPDVAKEPWVQILDAVFRERRKKELEAAERLKIYTDIDRADEAVLDILAVQFRVDWYDTSYPIETKRRIIKTALEVRRYCGTEWAVQKALASIYPNVKISEWYDYGGRPGYWRMNVDITDDGVIYYTPEEIEKRLGYARRCTAHLEHMQDARGVEVPSTKVNGDFEIELSALLAVSNKANISITVDPQIQALAKMVKAEVERHNCQNQSQRRVQRFYCCAAGQPEHRHL